MLAAAARGPKLCGMFAVDEDAAGAIRRAWDEGGEASAVAELRRRFLSITSEEDACACVRTILGWTRRPGVVPSERG